MATASRQRSPATAPTPASTPSGEALPGLRADGAERCVLTLSVQPNARHSECNGWHDGALRVRLAAPPLEGRANAALVEWLARELDVPKRAVQLRRGAASRHKQVEIALPMAQVAAWLRRQPA